MVVSPRLPVRQSRIPRPRVTLGLAPRLVALAVLLTSVTGTGVALWILDNARSTLRDQILATHLATADLVANRVASSVEDAQADALDLAGRTTILSAIDRGDMATFDRELERWQAVHRGRFDTLNLFDLQGTIQATSLADKSAVGHSNSSDRDWFRPVLATGEPFLGQAIKARTTGHPIVPYAVPLRGSDGTLKAVLTAAISLGSMSEMLHNLQDAGGRRTRASLADNAHDLVLVHFDPSRVLGPSAGRNAASQRARAGERGTMENIESSGEPTLASFAQVPMLPWSVLIQEPTAQAFAPIHEMTWRALAWVMVAMVIVGTIAGAAAVWITSPLRTLRATAERMADGDLGRRADLARTDEIGDLGRAVDRMAERLQASMRELTTLAHSDAVTGLPNRVLLRQTLQEALEGAAARGTPLALLVMDLDRFKEVNDTLGHQCGDLLLSQVGRRLAGALRRGDTIARMGGDEFAVVLPGANLEAAGRVAETLLRLLNQPFELEGQSVAVGVSIGATAFPDPGLEGDGAADALLRRGDVAMYVAKRSGAGWSAYSCEEDRNSRERLALVSELRAAIDHDQLVLYYQPKLACDDTTVAGVEALVRWPHPRQGLVLPAEFVPLAEQTGLSHPLSRWVLRSALRQHRAWRDAGLDLPVAVNLSMRDLHDARLPETIANLLAEQGVAPSALRLELTESILMSDAERALEVLSSLRALGVRISVDDFGTGYSSLSYLKRLPVDELKIDRSFVRDMARDENDRAIVRSTVDLAHNLGLAVVAEGVEDAATLGLLRRLGCDQVQGFYFTRPLPADELTRWLSEGLPAAQAA